MIFDLNNIKLPRKINPDPIVEAVVEIRFESELSPQNVVDKLLIEFGKEYSIKDLPLAEFPSTMRDQDPQLRFLPVKQLIKDGLVLQIGGRVISFVNNKDYVGWLALKEKVEKMVKGLKDATVVSQYKRLGIRYLNIFDYNISDKINFVLSAAGRQIIDEKFDLRLSIEQDHFQAAIKLSNNVRKLVGDKITMGSLVDIDAFTVNFQENQLMDLIEAVHLFEKKVFFALLKQDFVKENFAPEWD